VGISRELDSSAWIESFNSYVEAFEALTEKILLSTSLINLSVGSCKQQSANALPLPTIAPSDIEVGFEGGTATWASTVLSC
jgi:hypothetical protein